MGKTNTISPLRQRMIEDMAEHRDARALLDVVAPAADPQKQPNLAPDPRVCCPAHAPAVALARSSLRCSRAAASRAGGRHRPGSTRREPDLP